MTIRRAGQHGWRRTPPPVLTGAQATSGSRTPGVTFGLIVTMACAVALTVAGCSGDTVKVYEPLTDPTQLFMQLRLNYGAINLSTAPGYNTFQLTSTALNALGEPMTDLPAPTFRSSDTSRVTVSPTGLLTAIKNGTNITVITALTTSDNVSHADTAMINVNATTTPPPELATLTIAPTSPDSAILPIIPTGVKGDATISLWYNATFGSAKPQLKKYLKMLTAGGTTIASLQVEYLTLDPDVLDVQRRGNGAITTYDPGLAHVVVRTVAYGVAKADTTTFVVTAPVAQGVLISGDTIGVGSVFQPSSIVVRQDGLVYWANYWRPIGVVFDDPAAVSVPDPAGKVCTIAAVTGGIFGSGFASPRTCDADFPTDTTFATRYRVRQFPIPGTFTYRDTVSGFTGQVIVIDNVTAGP